MSWKKLESFFILLSLRLLIRWKCIWFINPLALYADYTRTNFSYKHTKKPWVGRKAQQQHVAAFRKTHFLDVGGFCIPSKAIIFISFQSRVRSKGCKKKPTHVNPAVFDGRAILSKAKDEQPHIVLLPSSEAEPKAPRAPLQLYWVTSKAL